MQCFVTTPAGHEELVHEELTALGVEDVSRTRGGVKFDGTLEQAYEACLWIRAGSRVLVRIASFSADTPDKLYAGAGGVLWSEHFGVEDSFAVSVTGTYGELKDERFSGLKIKDAIVDQFRGRVGARPSVDAEAPMCSIRARIHRGHVAIYIDVSGPPLHRRGYRTAAGPAPLRETVASAVLMRARWPALAKEGATLLDPMCGAGTLLVEGAWMAMDVAPGLLRDSWGWAHWRKHDAAAWTRVVTAARERAASGVAACRCSFEGFDADEEVLDIARENLERAGLATQVRLQRASIEKVAPESSGGLLVVNPPYGARLGEEAEALETFGALGEALRASFVGWKASVLAGDRGLGVRLGIRADRKNVVHNGPIKCDLLHFEITQELVDGAKARRAQWRETVDEAPVENRIRKNLRRLKPWLGREAPDCYRVYDADIPEFNAAIDRYPDAAVVFEYEAPAEVSRAKSSARLDAVVRAAAKIFDLPEEEVVVKRRRRQRGDAQYERMERAGQRMQVVEGSAKVLVNLRDYLDTGLFLDHRPIRRWFYENARDKRFLNLFCYTGVATVHAAIGGARTTTSVDLSSRYLDWAADNLRLNRCSPRSNALIRADVMEWMDAAIERGERWDLLFIDPPTFSNSKRMEGTFDVQRDHAHLLTQAGRLIAPGGEIVFSTNRRRFRIDESLSDTMTVEDITEWSLPDDFTRQRKAHHCFRLRPREG